MAFSFIIVASNCSKLVNSAGVAPNVSEIMFRATKFALSFSLKLLGASKNSPR